MNNDAVSINTAMEAMEDQAEQKREEAEKKAKAERRYALERQINVRTERISLMLAMLNDTDDKDTTTFAALGKRLKKEWQETLGRIAEHQAQDGSYYSLDNPYRHLYR